jgi:glycosyltransferase involved in cell wall biosynthesis
MPSPPANVPAAAKPRLLLVTHYFPAHRGGVEIVAAELASRLSSSFELHWLAANCDPAPSLPEARIEGQAAWNGLERFGLPWPIWGWRGWRTLYQAVGEADIIHLHDFIYPANIAAFCLARLRRKPVVITQHIGDIDYRNPVLKAVLQGVNRSLGRLILGRASQVIFISPRVKALFQRFTTFRSAPVYWPNGVNKHVYRPVAPAERLARRASLSASDGQPVVLFVGRFVEKKGLPFIRQLASLRPDWHWWLAGWGAEGPCNPASWQLPQVRVWEGRQGASLAELYQTADMLILPSYGEGFPLVVQESLACGTPCVISAETAAGAPAFPRAIRALPYSPATSRPAEWLAALEHLLGATDMAEIRQDAADFAARKWDWDELAGKYTNLFKRLRDQSKNR